MSGSTYLAIKKARKERACSNSKGEASSLACEGHGGPRFAIEVPMVGRIAVEVGL